MTMAIWEPVWPHASILPPRPPHARTSRANGALRVSVISVWEAGLLKAKGRLSLKMPCSEWVRQALGTPGLSPEAFTLEIAIESSRRPGEIHADPADRILIASARITGARSLTADERLLEYGRRR